MKEIKFKTIKKYGENHYSFEALSNRKADRALSSFQVLHELKGYPLYTVNDELEKDTEFKASLLNNNMVRLTGQYITYLFPTLADFENFIITRKHIYDSIVGNSAKLASMASYFKKKIVTDFPQKRFFTDNEGNRIPYMVYNELSSKKNSKNLENPGYDSVKKDERIIYGEDGNVTFINTITKKIFIFRNERDFNLWYIMIRKLWKGSEIVWRGMNPYGKNLLQKKEEQFLKLTQLLKIKREDLRYSRGKDRMVSDALKKFTFSTETVLNLFLPLTMYVGELQINTFGGEWKLIKNEVIDSYIPFIHFQNSNFDIGKHLMWEILNPDDSSFPPLTSILWNGKTRKPS